MKLFYVGQTTNEDGPIWEFQGIFDTVEAAIAACIDEDYWVSTCTLNQEIPKHTVTRESIGEYAWFPLLEDEPRIFGSDNKEKI